MTNWKKEEEKKIQTEKCGECESISSADSADSVLVTDTTERSHRLLLLLLFYRHLLLMYGNWTFIYLHLKCFWAFTYGDITYE